MSKRLWLALAFIGCAASAPPAHADDTFTGFGSTDFMNSMMDNVRMDSLRRHWIADHEKQGSPPPRKAAPDARPQRSKTRAAPSATTNVTTYRASPAVTKRVREQFIAWIGQTSGPAGASAMRKVMEQQDILALWTKQSAADGLKPGDLADAFAAYWVQNWQMANNVEVVSPAKVMAVRRQVAASIGAGLTEAQRQELAEVFIYNQFVQGTVWVEAAQRGDAAMKRKLGDASVVRFRNEMKLDLRALKISEEGFTAG